MQQHSSLSDSAFDKKAGQFFLWFSLALAIWLTLTTYPGVFYSDTFSRWAYAKELLTRTADGTLAGYASYLSHAPQFLLAVFYALTGNPASYTLFQSFFLFYSTYLLLWRIIVPNSSIAIAIATIFPAVWGYSVYQEMGVSTLIGFNCLTLLIFDHQNWMWSTLSRVQKTLFIVFAFGAAYMLFGFRQNALTLLPVIVVAAFLFFKAHPDKQRLLALSRATIAALLTIALLPAAFGFSQKYDASRPGMVWEVISTINAMPEEQALPYMTYFDDLFGSGVTADMLTRNAANNDSINPIWGACDIFTMGSPENKAPVLKKYITFIKAEPDAFLSNKWRFSMKTLGVTAPLREAEYAYNPADLMGRYGLRDTAQRTLFFRGYDFYTAHSGFLRRPVVLYLAALLLLLAEHVFCKKQRNPYSLYFFSAAVFYYGAFLLNNQSFEFRYFYPAMMMLLFGITCSAGALLCAAQSKKTPPAKS